uniref:Oxidoreductase GLYR1 homolog n=1 Tax=Culex pipiens TaxID=7175 RepID=A0A8D8KCB0_CULPI
MTMPSALETAEPRQRLRVASTPKTHAISNRTKVAIAAIEDITSSPSPKRKQKLNDSGDVSTLDLEPFSSVRRKVPVSHLLNRLVTVARFANSGNSFVVWNRIATKYHKFQETGAEVAETPLDVIKMTDVTLACLLDPQVAKDLLATVASCRLTSSARSTSSDRRRPGNVAGHQAHKIVSKGGQNPDSRLEELGRGGHADHPGRQREGAPDLL